MKIIEILVPEEIIDLLGSEDATRKARAKRLSSISYGVGKFPKAKRLNCWASACGSYRTSLLNIGFHGSIVPQRTWKKIWRLYTSSNKVRRARLEGGL